jgi:hypothetical protein
VHVIDQDPHRVLSRQRGDHPSEPIKNRQQLARSRLSVGGFWLVVAEHCRRPPRPALKQAQALLRCSTRQQAFKQLDSHPPAQVSLKLPTPRASH